jgi:uncharacterized protein (DUF1778 family)
MAKTIAPRQRRIRFPVSVPMDEADLELIDRAAKIRTESRASYIRRVILREARADLRDAERKQDAATAAA